MHWNQIVSKVSPYIVKIETPTGMGTGFLCFYNTTKSLCGIATALHVIDYAEEWEQPIRIIHHESNYKKLLKEPDRFIFKSRKTDSAVIIFSKYEFPFPKEVLQLLPTNNPIKIGNEVGWLGFPGIESTTLCFFSGNISARNELRKAYLIDGVAINGVSGGPVIYSTETDGIQIVGIVTAYQANRQRGDALPGLSIAQDVSYFHEVIKSVKSIDEAKREKPQIDAKIEEKTEIKNNENIL